MPTTRLKTTIAANPARTPRVLTSVAPVLPVSSYRIAKLTGMADSHVYRALNADCRMTLETAVKVAVAAGTTVDAVAAVVLANKGKGLVRELERALTGIRERKAVFETAEKARLAAVSAA